MHNITRADLNTFTATITHRHIHKCGHSSPLLLNIRVLRGCGQTRNTPLPIYFTLNSVRTLIEDVAELRPGHTEKHEGCDRKIQAESHLRGDNRAAQVGALKHEAQHRVGQQAQNKHISPSNPEHTVTLM